jgi:group I intron endonuclease
MSGIYKITNPKGEAYIGQSKNPIKRMKDHKYGDYKKNRKFNKSVLEYGWANHFCEILCECEVGDLLKLEEYYIKLYDTVNNGLNLTSGGKNPKYSDSAKLLMSSQRKGVKTTIEALEKRKIGREKNKEKFLIAMRNPELLERKSKWKSKKIAVISNVIYTIYDSVVLASKDLNIHKSLIAQFARGEKRHKNLKFQYI